MTTEEIIQQLNPIFEDILGSDKISLKTTTQAKDLEEWDSLNHIQLTVAIERHFKIRFSALEIQNWQNVGEIVNSISQKLSK